MTTPSVAPLAPRFEGVERIAVLRGGGLGDLVFALPAIDALAAAYPGAAITLLGAPAHRALLAGRAGSPVSDVEILPVRAGIYGQGPDEDPQVTAEFLERMRARRFDLAVQVHGGGRYSNPFLLELGARHTVGTRTPDAVPLERSLYYDYYQHEVLRWLEVAGLAGAAPAVLEPVVHASAAERAAGEAVLGSGRRLVLHPGATDPRRHWPTERFGEVAAAVAASGGSVTVIGDESETALAQEVVELAHAALPDDRQHAVTSAAGRLDLAGLVGVLAAADVVLANDSGPRHLAQAVGTRTVGIFIFGNTINAMPFGRGMHRLRLGRTTSCPVCGIDATQVGWSAVRCEHDPSYVADVTAAEVLEDVLDLLADAERERDA